MQDRSIDSESFIELVRPTLERRDAESLAAVVREQCETAELCDLMREGTLDARKVVCLTLGLVGGNDCTGCLARALHDADDVVAELAEHALWSIWFRLGNPKASGELKRGMERLGANEFPQAVPPLTRAIEADHGFAEAHNQRAIAYFMMEDWPMSLADCERAVELTPIHFGALAAAGHCHAQLGQFTEAAQCYREALAVNPRMHAVAGALEKLDGRVPATA
jgi:tetratricopeptide (TPR) repeat protein